MSLNCDVNASKVSFSEGHDERMDTSPQMCENSLESGCSVRQVLCGRKRELERSGELGGGGVGRTGDYKQSGKLTRK